MTNRQIQPMTSPFRQLLVRYLTGQISESAWKRIMRTFDVAGLDEAQRAAYARLYNEMYAVPVTPGQLRHPSV